MSLKHSIQAFFTLVPLALAGPITKRNANEAVVLANCASSWGEWSSEMAYYSTGGSSPSGTPAATAIVKSGNFQVWEGAQVSGTFSDGKVFTANIAEPISIHGMYAGTGQNSQSSFYCYQDAGSVTYPLSNGATCTSVYICDQTPAGVHVDISTNENYIELLGLGNVNTADVFNNVWAKRGAQSCDTTPVDLGQGCSISFTCSGGIPWTTTNGMTSTLESVVAVQNGISNHWTTQETSCTAYAGESEGPVCIQETTTNVDHTSIAQTITISVTDLLTNDAQGSLTYELFCAPPAPDCSAFNTLLSSLNLAIGIIVPEIAPFFAVTTAVLSAENTGTSGC